MAWRDRAAGLKLPATAHVVLGLVSIRPGAGHELAGFAERSIGNFFPIARSQVYSELERLCRLDMSGAPALSVTRSRRSWTGLLIVPSRRSREPPRCSGCATRRPRSSGWMTSVPSSRIGRSELTKRRYGHRAAGGGAASSG